MAPKLTSAKPAFVSRSKSLATDYVIYAAAPDGKDAAGPWPAVVVFDGDYFFDPAVAAYHTLRKKGAIPPLLLVGVGYGKPFGDPGNRRGRDYTPTPSSEEPGSGGAREFLAYFSSELWPTLTKRFPIDAEQGVLAGHSLSALFVLYAAFQSQPILRRAIIGAPSIWWDNRSVLAHLSRLRDAQDRLPAELYVGVGVEETPSMLGDLSLFDAQIRARPFADLHITRQCFPDRDHYNLVPDLFTGGLGHLFGGKR
jgi:predicted alpha/beta superfamily hydrolase